MYLIAFCFKADYMKYKFWKIKFPHMTFLFSFREITISQFVSKI